MCGILDFPAASRLEVGWAVLLIAAALMAPGSKSAESTFPEGTQCSIGQGKVLPDQCR